MNRAVFRPCNRDPGRPRRVDAMPAVVFAAILAATLGAVLATPRAVLAQTTGSETTLYSFTGGIEGQGPTDLIPYTDGNFYGTASNVVFKVPPGGTLTTLHTFCPSCATDQPKVSGITVGADGNFYGLTGATNAIGAAFFTISPAGAYTALNTAVPGDPAGGVGDASQLVLGTDGNFYGASAILGTPGSIFMIAPDGTLTTLYSFSATSGANETNTDGATPEGRLTLGTDGNFYGTTYAGGTYGSGTVFKMSPAGTLTSLYSFGAIGTSAGSPGQNLDGLFPAAGLTQGSDGNFYGGTTNGGEHGLGTLFKITPAGALTVLHEFSNATATALDLSISPASVPLGQSATLTWTLTGTPQSEGGGPLHSLLQAANGDFYGFGGEVASAADTVFQITPAGVYTTIIPASPSAANGGDPNSLFQTSSGDFYGTSFYGNDNTSPTAYGTVFKLAVSTSTPPTPCTASMNPATGGAWSGSQASSGTARVTPTATGTYTYLLSCTFPSPILTVGPQSVQLTVTAATTPKPTLVLSANPTAVTVGEHSVLTWSSTQASSCAASGAWSGSEALSGSATVTPTAAGSQTYTLTCTGAGGSTQASVVLAVSAAAVPASTGTTSSGGGGSLEWQSLLVLALLIALMRRGSGRVKEPWRISGRSCPASTRGAADRRRSGPSGRA